MTRTWRVVTVFLFQEEVEELQRRYKMSPDKAIESVVRRDLKFLTVLNRCCRCQKEVALILEKKNIEQAKRFGKTTIAQCSRCRPGSKWTRVEEME